MNKKLFSLLLLLPIGFFAADKVLGLNATDGGNDQQKKQSCTAQSAQAGEMPELVSLDDLAPAALAEMRSMAKGMQAMMEMDAEASAYYINNPEFDEIEAAAAEYHAGNRASAYDERIQEADKAFMDKEINEVLDEVDVFDLVLSDQFSRCGSGYHYEMMVDADNQILDQGFLVRDQGCWDRPIAVFHVDLEARRVGVKFPGDRGMLSIRDFLSLLVES